MQVRPFATELSRALLLLEPLKSVENFVENCNPTFCLKAISINLLDPVEIFSEAFLYSKESVNGYKCVLLPCNTVS